MEICGRRRGCHFVLSGSPQSEIPAAAPLVLYYISLSADSSGLFAPSQVAVIAPALTAARVLS